MSMTEAPTARCASCGRPLPSPYATCAPCTGIVDSGPWPAPTTTPPPGMVLRALRGLVRPRRAGITQAVSDDLTAVAVVSALAACLAGLVAASLPFATVGGVTTSLSDDRSAGVCLVLICIAGLLGLFTARLPSGWGLGLLAGVVSGIPFVGLRAVAVTLGDGSAAVAWESGFVLLGFASAIAVVPLLCALSGLRRGRALARVPVVIVIVGLGAVVVVASWRRDGVVAVAADLGPPARLALASVLGGELVMLTLAVASRSRVGGGIFLGAATLPAAYWLADAGASDVAFDLVDPTRLVSTAALLAGVGLMMTLLARPPRLFEAAAGPRTAPAPTR